MSIFQFDNYKTFVKSRVSQMPKQGRGEYQNLAKVLQMHTTTISHVFKGDKDLTLEQAARLSQHWGFSTQESDYFITLVELARAGSIELKKILKSRLEDHRQSSVQLKHRIPKDHVLSESDRFRFYSDWYYSAIRLLCDIPAFKTVDRIAHHLDLPVALVNDTIQFLLRTGLIVEEKGQLKLGPSRTFLEASSSLVNRHHANWRMKATNCYPNIKHDVELALTSPMTVSKEDAARIREILMSTVEEILSINKPSKSEELRVLNIDWLLV